MFSANLRLSPGIAKEEKEERVEEIITELGLTHVADSKVIFSETQLGTKFHLVFLEVNVTNILLVVNLNFNVRE